MSQANIKIHPLPSGSSEPIKKEVGQLSLDIYQTDKEIVILAPIAGVGKDNINIAITDEVLVIKGTRPLKDQISEDCYYTKECFWGDFSRSIVLPEEADVQNASASFENNVLEIKIPKKEIERTKIIKIRA
jgi:HSP20 family protein